MTDDISIVYRLAFVVHSIASELEHVLRSVFRPRLARRLCGMILLPCPDRHCLSRLVDVRMSKEYLMFGALLNIASY
jgi:hypothetical protein